MDDLMKRLEFCLMHKATGALPPDNLMAEAFGLLEDQQARIDALEAQVKAADGLAETTDTQARLLKEGVGTVKGRINIVADRLLSASAAYRAAKEASHE